MPISDRLSLPDGAHVKVFDVLVNRIKADPDLRRVVRTWQTWDGMDDDAPMWGQANTPGLSFTPQVLENGYVCEDSLGSNLVVLVEQALSGARVRDHLRLWRAVKRSVRMSGGAGGFDEALRNAEAYPHLVKSEGLEIGQMTDAGVLIATGRLVVGIREGLST